MSKKQKSLLTEGEMKRMFKLANIAPLYNPFKTRLQEGSEWDDMGSQDKPVNPQEKKNLLLAKYHLDDQGYQELKDHFMSQPMDEEDSMPSSGLDSSMSSLEEDDVEYENEKPEGEMGELPPEGEPKPEGLEGQDELEGGMEGKEEIVRKVVDAIAAAIQDATGVVVGVEGGEGLEAEMPAEEPMAPEASEPGESAAHEKAETPAEEKEEDEIDETILQETIKRVLKRIGK